jgi:hypothetical protein
MTINYL